MKDNISTSVTVTFEAFDNIPQSLCDFLDSYFEVSSVNYLDNNQEQYVGYADLSFDEQDLLQTALKKNISLPKYKIEILENKNWLTENIIKFAPIEVSDFCIYGIHEKNTPQTKKIPLQLYAATAFGSTHQTTHMCLNALSDLAHNGFIPTRVLDVGTGSGILSIAGAKKWQKSKPRILGVDIDRESINVAAQNAFDNHVEDFIDISYSNGFKSEAVKNNAPYDLVFANILARPLISMAKDMAKHVSPQAYVVLSGFTSEQTDWVLNVYEKNGFKRIKMYKNEHWRAALLQKKEKISQLQNKLSSDDAFLVSRDNMFLNEDLLDCENKILELTNFTGSAGILFVLKDKVLLLVDGRYSIQARQEVFKNVTVIDSQNFFKDLIRLSADNQIKTLKVNPWTISVAQSDFLKQSGLNLKEDKNCPMSSVFLPQKIFRHSTRFAGLSSKEKCQIITKLMPKDCDALFISKAEDVSWLSNLRAIDLPNTPIFRAYGLLYKNGKLRIYTYDKIKKLIKDLNHCARVIIKKDQTPLALFHEIKNACDIGFDVLPQTKTQKNSVELKGFINAHIRDGVAMVKFLSWLETHYQGLSELDVVQKLHDFRARQKNYFSESFGTIAAVNSNAAIVHYEPTSKTNKKLPQNAILLIDSGAQYFDGTTDITRTLVFGNINKEVKQSFTLVLKAHIALASATFKEGLPANKLDQICRHIMLKEGKDFKHGTGHSVGHFSNVHEPPFAINASNDTPVLEHYITSIEPGYYKENAYGIRIENLYYTTCDHKKGYLHFEPLTLCPIDLKGIEISLLTEQEKFWLNSYHQKVLNTLKPYLSKYEKGWLERKCISI